MQNKNNNKNIYTNYIVILLFIVLFTTFQLFSSSGDIKYGTFNQIL